MLQAWTRLQSLAVVERLLLEVLHHVLHLLCLDLQADILEPNHHPSDLLDVHLQMLAHPLEWVEELLALVVLQCEVRRLHQTSLGILLCVANVHVHILGNHLSSHVVQDVVR